MNVYDITRNLIGTAEGNQKLGLGAGGDWSRKMDVEAEETIIRSIKKHGLSPTFIGEECGLISGHEGYLVIDPIDGTTNASVGLPFYCCSLAYAEDNKLSSVTQAAILDLHRGDIYTASRNKGAWFNDTKIRQPHKKLQEDELIIGINLSGISSNELYIFSKIIVIANHVRLFGANALELCYLAQGSLDAYLDFRGRIRATDMAAAYLIVKEAGGYFYSPQGQNLDAELGVNSRMSYIAFSNDNMYDLIFDALRG